MITNGEGWHYLAVTKEKLPALLRGIISKQHGKSYFLNCRHSLAAKKLDSHTKLCENKDFCNIVIVIPSEDTKILEFNEYQQSDREPFIIYEDLECLAGKIEGCRNNPENSSATKVGKLIP